MHSSMCFIVFYSQPLKSHDEVIKMIYFVGKYFKNLSYVITFNALNYFFTHDCNMC